MSDPKKIGIAEIGFVGTTLVALIGQWTFLDERVDILEQKLEYHKTEILENSQYRDQNQVLDAEQELRIKYLEEK